MSSFPDSGIQEIFIPQLGKSYAAPTENQMYTCCDLLVDQLRARGQTFTRIASINDGATSWVEFMAGSLRSVGVLDDSEKTGGIGKIAPLAFRHYVGEEGGRLKKVKFFPSYSAAKKEFNGQAVVAIEKVTETGGTWEKYSQVMARRGTLVYEFATLVPKLPADAPGPEVVGHRASAPDVWYIFPPQRPIMVGKIYQALRLAGVSPDESRDILVGLFKPTSPLELGRLLRQMRTT